MGAANPMPNQSRLSARRLEKLTHQAKRARHLKIEYSGTLASDLYLEHAKSCEAKAHALQAAASKAVKKG
jgi:hypothetical protein